ncbi:hypothetical protein CRG98_002303 [Punica granatum]|uniref:Uncharacterized protein n=1 Tax=Punica granatum TaxID=22663 RepID=A0A2I0L9I5_PUNGR|nr:hypothetical protein CRG98_002303 [Punica granatum]
MESGRWPIEASSAATPLHLRLLVISGSLATLEGMGWPPVRPPHNIFKGSQSKLKTLKFAGRGSRRQSPLPQNWIWLHSNLTNVRRTFGFLKTKPSVV